MPPVEPRDPPPIDVGGGIAVTPAAAAAAQTRRVSLDRLRSLLGPAFSGATVTTDYGGPTWGTLQPHTGIDLAAAQGTPVQDPIGGTVSRVWTDSIGGNQVSVKTPQGYTETFAHLAFIPAFVANTPGAGIPQGGIIGYVGQSGMASGPHLHYEVTKAGGSLGTMLGSIDPLAFIGEFASASSAGEPGRYTDPLTAAKVAKDVSAAQKSNASSNPLDAIGSIAANVGQLTGDLTNPQTWARVGLTLAAVGLIGVGMVLYVGSAAPKPRLPV